MKSVSTLLIILTLSFFVGTSDYAGGKGGALKGKPFIELQGQINEVQIKWVEEVTRFKAGEIGMELNMKQ